jgi:hypothetical protein
MMNSYFYQLDIPILTESEKDKLVELATFHNDDFKAYVSVRNVIDGNETWRDTDLYELPFIKRLTENCTLPCIPVFVRHQPAAKVIKHTDDPNKRNTVLSIPLTPKVGYSPTYFFTSREETKPAAIATFPNLNACLLNTQEVHGLINTSSDMRINFQLAFNESFELVREMIINKTLFTIEI